MEYWGFGEFVAFQYFSTPSLQHFVFSFSPDITNQFAAQILFAGIHPGHHPARGRDNGGAHAPEHARNFRRANVAAQPRFAHALQTDDHALAPLILQLEFEFFGGLGLGRRGEREPAARNCGLLGSLYSPNRAQLAPPFLNDEQPRGAPTLANRAARHYA